MLVIGKFEQLPNEILLEVFTYLNGFDIYNGFNQLNSRFDRLLKHCWYEFTTRNFEEFNLLCKTIISYITPQQIKAIRFYDFGLENNYFPILIQLNIFFDRFNIENFINLKLIKINEIHQSNDNDNNNEIADMNIVLKYVIENLYKLPNLTYFDMCLTYENCTNKTIQFVYKTIFNLPTLKSLVLTIAEENDINFFQYQQSNLESLTILAALYMSDIKQILTFNPNLKYLCIIDLSNNTITKYQWNNNKLLQSLVPNLKNVRFHFNINVSCDDIILLIQQLPEIQKLTICKDYRGFIEKESLKRSIQTSLPLLEKLKLTFKDVSGDPDELIDSDDELTYNLEEFIWCDIHNEIMNAMNHRN